MKKKARDLRAGDRLSLRPSASLGFALDAPDQEVEIASVSRIPSSGGCRIVVWVVGVDRAYACLRGSTSLLVQAEESNN